MVNLKINNVVRERQVEDDFIRLDRNMLIGKHDDNILNFTEDLNIEEFSFYPKLTETYDSLSNSLGISSKNLLITKGVGDALRIIFNTYSFEKNNRKVLFQKPNYAMYRVFSDIFKHCRIQVPIEQILNIQDFNSVGMVAIVNPSPYDYHIKNKELNDFIVTCQKYGILIVLDEIYSGFGTTSILDDYDINSYENLIVVNSYSKSHMLPSMRIGYIISNEKIINELGTTRLCYELSYLESELLKYVIKYNDYFVQFKNGVIKEHKKMKKSYKVLRGDFTFNLYLDWNEDKVKLLKQEGIIVGKYLNNIFFSVPLLGNVKNKVEDILL